MPTSDQPELQARRVLEVVRHSPRLVSLYVEAPFAAAPGQHVSVAMPGAEGERPFSISDLADGRLELSVKACGAFSSRLVEAKPGDPLAIRGPLGEAFALEDDGLLVAGGIGLAPIRFLSRRLSARGLAHRLLIGLRSRSDLIFPEDYGGARITSEDGSIGVAGLVTELLEGQLAQRRPKVLYAAGPEPMLLAAQQLAERFAVSFQLAFEGGLKTAARLDAHVLDRSGFASSRRE